MLNKIQKAIEDNISSTSFCINLTEEEIVEIYNKCVYTGLFSKENYGIHDIKNSVYLFISTLFEIK